MSKFIATLALAAGLGLIWMASSASAAPCLDQVRACAKQVAASGGDTATANAKCSPAGEVAIRAAIAAVRAHQQPRCTLEGVKGFEDLKG